jgi:glycosyltransferase involved in cell wall biosynthesis
VSTASHRRARPAVSVVIPTRDRVAMLDRCLASVRAAVTAGDEVVVVDSASGDAAAVAAVAARHGAALVRCDRPGVNRARNAGWRATTRDLVVFTDDDVEVDAHWVDAYVDAAARHPDASFLTGRVTAPPGQDDRWEVAVKTGAGHRIDAGTRGTLGHGANLAVRRSALLAVGGWDEALGAGARFASAPEVDLFDRLLARGDVGWFEPAASARHDQWRSRAQVVRLHLRYGIGIGARIAKLLRTDPRRALFVVRESWWSWGLVSLAQRLRHVDKTGTVVDLTRMLGYVLGFVMAVATPVRDGHFRPRRSD